MCCGGWFVLGDVGGLRYVVVEVLLCREFIFRGVFSFFWFWFVLRGLCTWLEGRVFGRLFGNVW